MKYPGHVLVFLINQMNSLCDENIVQIVCLAFHSFHVYTSRCRTFIAPCTDHGIAVDVKYPLEK